MKRISGVLFAVVMAAIIPTAAFAGKTTYIANDHRFNYVKLSEVKNSLIEMRKMTHPVTLDENGVRTALASIKLARSYIVKKEVDTQQVFDERSINFLAPNLTKALAQASPAEEIVFSYLSKEPLFVLRNDRLTMGKAWVEGNELHISFDKLYAKLIGDVDKRGNEAKAAARAQGLRVSLELSPGQKLGIQDTDEIVLDLHYDYAQKPLEVAPVNTTMAGDKIPDATPADDSKKKGKKESKAKQESLAQAAPAAVTPTLEDRIRSLDDLKKKGLLSKKEYEEKKREILKGL